MTTLIPAIAVAAATAFVVASAIIAIAAYADRWLNGGQR